VWLSAFCKGSYSGKLPGSLCKGSVTIESTGVVYHHPSYPILGHLLVLHALYISSIKSCKGIFEDKQGSIYIFHNLLVNPAAVGRAL
jgi:hypothetical protein